MPAVVHNVEYEPWSSIPVDQPPSEPSSTRLVTNCQATCRLFQVTAEGLDQMYALIDSLLSKPGFTEADIIQLPTPIASKQDIFGRLGSQDPCRSIGLLHEATKLSSLASDGVSSGSSTRLPATVGMMSLNINLNIRLPCDRLQYNVVMILLHRPFIMLKTEKEKKTTRLGAASHHMKECRTSAETITNIFKSYRNHYSLVSPSW